MVVTSFQGGGFRSHSAFTGILAALMARMTELDLAPTPTVESLFEHVEAVTSNSGGSWFVADLAYSSRYLEALEQSAVAASGETAKGLYSKVYIEPFVNTVEKPTSAMQANFQMMVEKLGVSGLKYLAKVINVWSYLFTDEETSWQTIVEGLANATGIAASTTMGTKSANDWTEDKDWLVQLTVLTPFWGDWIMGTKAYLYSDTMGMNYLRYSISSNDTLGDTESGGLQGYVPARFSTSWRKGEKKPAPYPFCSVCEKLNYHYESNRFGPMSYEAKRAGTTKTWQQEMGSLRVTDVMSASSAAGAGAAIAPLGPLRGFWGLEPPKFAVFGVDEPGSKAFAKAKKYTSTTTWSYDALQEVAGEGLVALADGGYVDNTAVASAVLTGAPEVVAFTNNMVTGPGCLQALFTGARKKALGENMVLAYYPLFKENVSVLKEQWNELTDLKFPDGCCSWLSAVNVGKVTATVMDNQFWDVKGQTGRVVTLYIVNTITMIPDAPLSDDNSILVQELVDTLLYKPNLPLVDEILTRLQLQLS